MNYQNVLRRCGILVIAMPAFLAMSGCAAFSCDDYMTYNDVLDTWVGADLSNYESRTNRRPLNVMERPQNRLEYAFDTPYRNFDGSEMYCRTWLEVDRGSGEIVNWRYEGDCYMHGFCRS